MDRRLLYIALFVALLFLDALTPRAIYGWLFAKTHPDAGAVYFDPICWQVTMQYILWIAGCMALIGVCGVLPGLFQPQGGWLLKIIPCRECGHGLLPEDFYCPSCAKPTAAWELPRHMLSERARLSSGLAHDPAVPKEVTDAARFIAEQSRPRSASAATELASFCLTNDALLRRLYFAAALRLHPDRNDGALHAEWERLQIAVRTLRAYQRRMAAEAAASLR